MIDNGDPSYRNSDLEQVLAFPDLWLLKTKFIVVPEPSTHDPGLRRRWVRHHRKGPTSFPEAWVWGFRSVALHLYYRGGHQDNMPLCNGTPQGTACMGPTDHCLGFRNPKLCWPFKV